MSSQIGDTVQFSGGKNPAVVMAGRLVVKLLWGQCGLEGSFTNHSSAATSQSEMISPLGRMQSSSVLLVHVPVHREATRQATTKTYYQTQVGPWHLSFSSSGSLCPTGQARGKIQSQVNI